MKHYCGPPQAWEAAKKGPIPKELLEQYRKRFGIAFAYQKLIADCNGLNPFDVRVVEAYWLGNELLDQVPTEKVKQMFESDYSWNKPLIKTGESIPEGVKPYHNFHVMHVFAVLGRLSKTVENQKQCMVLPAQVLNEKTVELVDGTKRMVDHVFDKVVEGDLVVVHWDAVPQKINREQLFNLTRITGRHAKLLKCDWVLSLL
jgi:hypothetical protein